jgi:putative flippase GtrA
MSSGQKKLARFCVAGGVVALADLGMVRLFAFVLAPLAAVGTAYLLAVGLHFCLNRWWVFAARQAPATGQLKRYALTVAACWASTLIIAAFALATVTSHVVVAKMLAIPPVTLLGFVLMRGFVFRPASGEASGQCTG